MLQMFYSYKNVFLLSFGKFSVSIKRIISF